MGNWDPDELSSLHSSPSPIHRHPFSDNPSPTDPTEPHHNDVEPEEQNPDDPECTKHFVPSPLNPIESFDFNQSSEQVHSQIREPLEARNQQQDHSKARVIQFTEAAGVTTQRNGRLPDLTQTAEKHFNLSNQRKRSSSSSESRFSSPELNQSREEKFDSTCTNRESRVKTHNNNDVQLKSSEKDQNSSTPPTQASK